MLTLPKSGRDLVEQSEPLIRKTPGVCGGDACIRRTRIPVWTLVRMRQLGMTDEAIAESFAESLEERDLNAAWDYYRAHGPEIDAAIRDDEAA